MLQEYKAYQELLALVEATQHSLQIAETRQRLRQMNSGALKIFFDKAHLAFAAL